MKRSLSLFYGAFWHQTIYKDLKLSPNQFTTFKFLFIKLLKDAEKNKSTFLIEEIKSHIEKLNLNMTLAEVDYAYGILVVKCNDAAQSLLNHSVFIK